MPLLREFDLDIPHDTMNRIKFRNQTRCITALFERLFPKFYNEECWKVLIQCVNNIKHEKYKNLLGVYAIEIECNTNNFFQMSDNEKKQMAYMILAKGLYTLLRQKQWEEEIFKETLSKMLELNLNNNWYWKKPIKSPNRKYKAQVYLEHEILGYNIFITIKDALDNILKQQLILSQIPNEFSLSQYLGKLFWETENSVIFTTKDNLNTFTVSIEN